MRSVLLEDKRKLLANEFGSRHAARASGPGQKSIMFSVERNRRGLFPCECHRSNITISPSDSLSVDERDFWRDEAPCFAKRFFLFA